MMLIRSAATYVATLFLFVITMCASPPVQAHAADLPIYSDSLASGWENWSWGSTTNPAATTPVKSGTTSLAVTIGSAWGALYLHTGQAVDLSGFTSLRFWIHGGSSAGQQIRIVANRDTSATAPVVAANSWTQIEIPLAELGSPASLSALYWQDTSDGAQSTFYLDDIVLVGGVAPPPPPPGSGPTITVDTTLDRHPISEYIYGMNFASEALAQELRLPVNRRGGNSTSRYNWQIDVYNTGSDWYFENITEAVANPSALPNGSSADLFVEQDRRTASKSILTIPMIGWVAKQRKPAHPYDCGFSIQKYGPQDGNDGAWDPDCGNGLHNGVALAGNDPTDTSVAATPAFAGDWISHLTSRYGTAAAGGVAFYNLDNEPMLWNSTHRDVHPAPVSYDEIRDRTYQYAADVKAADPAAQTLGPVLWGWCAYLYSAKDGCSIGSDYQSHGNTPFVPWYLQQMKAYQEQQGTRILDYLDLHYYPQASGVSLSTAGSSTTQALRLRSTRGLWDPAYRDESWINDMVRLIPRMKEWVAANYPGTKLAITEYNWGGFEHINGALAQADVLGIFGREGLDLATVWGPPETGQPGAFAFRMYRNYDGSGRHFGETGFRAVSANQDQLAVYAAQRSSDTALTLLFINKTTSSLTSKVTLAGAALPGSAAVYRYSAAVPGAIQHLADQPLEQDGFSATFPASSITMVEIMPATHPLQVSLSGTGFGSVASLPSGISCSAAHPENCSAPFPAGSSVTLQASPDSGSVFSGWGGDCSGSASCTPDMSSERNVSATFTAAPDVRIGMSSYLSLQQAYDESVSGDSILLLEGSRDSTLLADRAVNISIKGGYADGYGSVTGERTTLTGGMTIRNGSVRFARVAIR